MKIFSMAILAGLLALAGAAQADNGRGPTSKQISQYVDDIRNGSSVTGDICRNSRDFRNHVAQNRGAKHLPKLTGSELRRVTRMASDPEACRHLTVHYIGEMEPVDRIVRRPGEVYCIKRIVQVGVLGMKYEMPVLYIGSREFRYLLRPCE